MVLSSADHQLDVARTLPFRPPGSRHHLLAVGIGRGRRRAQQAAGPIELHLVPLVLRAALAMLKKKLPGREFLLAVLGLKVSH
jgi:hypothetical protein